MRQLGRGLLACNPSILKDEARVLRIPSLPRLYRKTLFEKKNKTKRKSSVRQVLCRAGFFFASMLYGNQYILKCPRSAFFSWDGTGLNLGRAC